MDDTVDNSSKPADPDKARELWVEVVRSASDRGKLEKIPTQYAKNKREKKTADMQRYWLSKKSFGSFHKNYDFIKWGKNE